MYDAFVKELHHGSTILLAYFHYCNKGSHPLLMDWEVSLDIPLADLNTEQVRFMRETSEHVKEKCKPTLSLFELQWDAMLQNLTKSNQ